jgi:hypothetical protein
LTRRARVEGRNVPSARCNFAKGRCDLPRIRANSKKCQSSHAPGAKATCIGAHFPVQGGRCSARDSDGLALSILLYILRSMEQSVSHLRNPVLYLVLSLGTTFNALPLNQQASLLSTFVVEAFPREQLPRLNCAVAKLCVTF